MTALTEFLFPAPAKRSVRAILGWWESRRLAYNAIVGGAGLVSLGIMNGLASLPPDPYGAVFPVVGIVVVGVLANLCYLLGATVEIGVEKLSKGEVLPTGPVLYRMGLTFSTGLVLLPSLIMGFDWVFRVVRALF